MGNGLLVRNERWSTVRTKRVSENDCPNLSSIFYVLFGTFTVVQKNHTKIQGMPCLTIIWKSSPLISINKWHRIHDQKGWSKRFGHVIKLIFDKTEFDQLTKIIFGITLNEFHLIKSLFFIIHAICRYILCSKYVFC